MKALVYTAPEQLVVQDMPEPQPQGDEVLVKVECVGICGSDMHAWKGHDERRPAPLILGHEVAGEIASGEQIGQRVTVNPLVTCMDCDYCNRGQTNLCQNRQIISMPPRQGGFTEYISISPRNLININDDISFEQAALTEPIAVAWHAVRLAQDKSSTNFLDAKVLILGGGAIGVSCALVCEHFGCADVCIAETNHLRHDILTGAGSFSVYDPIKLEPPHSEFDLIIDAYGGTTTQKMASELVKPGGIIVNVGLAGGEVALDVRRMTLQDITFVGSYTYTQEDFQQTADAINQKKLGALDWTQTYSLREGPKLFQLINSGTIKAPKVLLYPDG